MGFQQDLGPVALQNHVVISRSDPGVAGLHGFSIHPFANGEGRFGLEPFGKKFGEKGRHVLDQYNGNGEVLGKDRKKFRQGVGASRGNTDCH